MQLLTLNIDHYPIQRVQTITHIIIIVYFVPQTTIIAKVWEEWMGQVVEDTEWRGKTNGQWRAMEQAAVRRDWIKDMERGKVYDRG